MSLRLDPPQSTEHWRITHFALRLLDGQHAELRVYATAPRREEDPLAQEHCCFGLDPPVLANGSEDLADTAFEPAALPGAPDDEEPVSWTAVVPLEALPRETREALRRTPALYECEQFDLGAGGELERLLEALGAMAWTPEALSGAVH